MRFARLGDPGHETPVVIDDDDTTFDLRPVTQEIDGRFLAQGGVEQVRMALARHQLTALPGAKRMRIGTPVARPSAIICIGQNYAAHAAESGNEPPTEPVIFLKTPNTFAGPNDLAYIPRNSVKTDWEVELGVVIGARASYVPSKQAAADCIAGYVLANDLSERTFQMEISGNQWSKGKCCPGFSPVGPWFVPADEVDPHHLQLRSWVNGEPRQNSNTADMIFDVETLIYELSKYLAFDPGDIIFTGTPQGVAFSGKYPYLKAGDVVEVEIDHLGRSRQEFAQA